MNFKLEDLDMIDLQAEPEYVAQIVPGQISDEEIINEDEMEVMSI